jgi:hypothetical protein
MFQHNLRARWRIWANFAWQLKNIEQTFPLPHYRVVSAAQTNQSSAAQGQNHWVDCPAVRRHTTAKLLRSTCAMWGALSCFITRHMSTLLPHAVASRSVLQYVSALYVVTRGMPSKCPTPSASKNRRLSLSSRTTKFGFYCILFFGRRRSWVFPLHYRLFSFEKWQGAPKHHRLSLSDIDLISFSFKPSEMRKSSLNADVSSLPSEILVPGKHILRDYPALHGSVACSPDGNPKATDKSRIVALGFQKLVNPLVLVHNRPRCRGDLWDYHHGRPFDHFDMLHCH